MIEYVEQFRSELESEALCEFELSSHRQIKLRDWKSPEGVATEVPLSRNASSGRSGWSRKRGRIESPAARD